MRLDVSRLTFDGRALVADLRVRSGGAVAGEHIHPTLHERFSVVSGRIGYKLGGKTGVARAGDVLDLPRGVPHDWWNAGDEEAQVIVQVGPATRFEQMISTLFGLLAPLGRRLGYRAVYPEHQRAVESVEVEPLPQGITLSAL